MNEHTLNLLVLCGGLAFFSLLLIAVSWLWPANRELFGFVSTTAGGFSGALLLLIRGGGTQAPPPKPPETTK